MKFPGKRKTKHYFPVETEGRMPFEVDFSKKENVYIVGIDQLLVDIEVEVDDEFLEKYSIPKGESVVLDSDIVEEIYWKMKKEDRIIGEYAGGAVGNTLHNYCVLTDDRSVALGTICENIRVGDYAFKYICSTSSKVDFNYLQPCQGHMGRAMCFLTPDKERTFAIGKGIMNELKEEFIPEEVVARSSALLVTAFLLRDKESPMYQSTLKACKIAKENNVPVVFALGTSFLIEGRKEEFLDFINEYATIVAMNEQEAHALTGIDDPLLSCEKVLEYTDMILLTVGKRGLYIASYVDEKNARETKDMIHTKSIAEYNLHEYSRAQKKSDCEKPIKIYTHINPYMGGPGEILNTNGAGDAALSALLHDVAANVYHQMVLPNSPKHKSNYLTYSSIHQICKYANRASYEVLKQNSPRLSQGLPQKEESLEESYWEL
ncbi:inosine/guanosine kinase [Halobacteriovorax sp. GB3]|uniref:inosine/guanosine kinase n=1 Tax=Halobacteriovorax sp. GB3 TaxID=2719615 RepID=UPI00235EEF54|nr:inosine/guanosine kinase [Halobacteriovorax sp. GB3]MDD0853060.1 inosine/guanosine kinase [Halobacteriovorax sp. GB3]